MTETLFNSSDNQTEPTIEVVKQKFVKEDGTVDQDAVFNKVLHADKHIAQIEAENANLRKEVDSRLNYQDLLDRLAETRSANSESQDHVTRERDEDPKITEDAIDKLIERKLTIKQQEALHASNTQFVVKELAKTFGPDYVQKLKQKAIELDMSEQEMNAMAALKPKALLALVTPAQARGTDNSFSPPRSTTSTTANSNSGIRNWAYYQNKIRENPKISNDPKFNAEMHAEAMKQKESFYS